MSESIGRFVDLALEGRVTADEIDDFVAAWHDGNSAEELHEFLGFTFDEYSLWVRSANALTLILSARHRKQPIVDAVNDNYLADTTIPPSKDRSRLQGALRSWLSHRS